MEVTSPKRRKHADKNVKISSTPPDATTRKILINSFIYVVLMG
jgi:hypothetical protein